MKLNQTLAPVKGIYHGIDPSDYFRMTHAEKDGKRYVIPSKSMLTIFSKNPQKWKTAPPFVKTPAMVGGSLLDCLLLTPNNVGREFILKPDSAPRRPTEAQLKAVKKSDKALESISYWDAFDRKAKGKDIITAGQMDAAKKAVKQLKSHPKCAAILEHSQKQTVCVAEYRGYIVKGMFDLVPDDDGPWGDTIIDLKRTSGFTPQEFKTVIRKYGYHKQSAFYKWLLKETTGQDRPNWKFMMSDSEAPYGCGLITMHPDDTARGHREIFAALDLYIECVEKDEWPSPYPASMDDMVLKSFSDNF